MAQEPKKIFAVKLLTHIIQKKEKGQAPEEPVPSREKEEWGR